MAGERKCAKCRFYKDAGISGNGWCTHPKRQQTTDHLLLVRGGELACRNDWGGDLFQSRDEAPQDQDPDGVEDLPAASRDDEVTSVVTRPERAPSGVTEEDRVVSDRPAPQHRDEDDDPWNDAAHREQEERARIIARGSRDALMHARERHSNRRSRDQRDAADEASNTSAASHERVVTHQERFTDRAPARFSGPADSGGPVPRAEIESRQQPVSERYDSVPEIDPNFDLPGWSGNRADPPKDGSPAPEQPVDAAGAAPVQHTAYESVLQRARRTREQRVRNRQIRHMRSEQRGAAEAPADAPVNAASDDLIVMAAGPEPVPPAEPSSRMPHDAGAAAAPVAEPTESEPHPDDPSVAYRAPDEPYDDELDRFEEPYAQQDALEAEADSGPDDWDAWHDDDTPAPQREQPQRGWLSRLGLGRRGSATWHDEAMPTRHAEPEPAYLDDGWDDGDDGAYLAAVAEPQWDDEAAPQPSRARSGRAPHPRWEDHAATEDDVAYDNTRTYRHDFAEEDLAPIPGPVPSGQPRQEPIHRQRLVRELPDLDDNLFEERFDRTRPEPSPARAIEREHRALAPVVSEPPATPPVSPRGEAPHDAFPASPRESYFRAARYRDWSASHSPVTDAEEREVDLPDLAEHDFDLRDVVARGGELLDMTIDIAPEVPRECRTCRSFRSADGGARGWCTNEWAFTHRRMVNEDDLACDSTVGCWWLPDDRYCVAEEQHGYPSTPRMDELIARLSRSEEPPKRERTTG